MTTVKSYIASVNRLFTEFYKLSTELQILVCIVLWVYIAILMRLMYLGGGVPSDHTVMISFLILLVGLMALLGGMLQRLVHWLNQELYAAQHLNVGTDLPN